MWYTEWPRERDSKGMRYMYTAVGSCTLCDVVDDLGLCRKRTCAERTSWWRRVKEDRRAVLVLYLSDYPGDAGSKFDGKHEA